MELLLVWFFKLNLLKLNFRNYSLKYIQFNISNLQII